MPNGRHLRVQHTYRPVTFPPSWSSKGRGEVEGELRQHDGVVELAVLWQSFAKHYYGGGGVGEGEGCARGKGEALMRLPTIYRGGGGWFLALQVHWGVGKGGGKKSLPHRLLSPFFRDLDLIPSGYDLIPSKGGVLVLLDQGCGALTPLPTFMWVLHAGGPHSGTF